MINVSDKHYEHALKVWDAFEMKKMKDDHDLHLKFVFLLLAGEFEKLRNKSLNIILVTKTEIEFISDSNIYLFFEKAMTDGFSFVYKRYNKGNSKF